MVKIRIGFEKESGKFAGMVTVQTWQWPSFILSLFFILIYIFRKKKIIIIIINYFRVLGIEK